MSAQTLYAILYLQVNLASVVLLIIIRFKTLGLSKMVAQRNFSMATDAMVIFFASDTVWKLIETGVLPYSSTGILICKNVYFLSTSLMCYFWFVYFEYLQESALVKNRKRMFWDSFFVWIQGIVLVVNHFTGILFYIDDQDVYRRGPFFSTLYLFAYIYVAFTCSRALIGVFNPKKAASKEKLIRLALFPIAPAAGGIIQFFYPQIPVECTTLSIAALLLYLDWISEMISVDPLTHLNNRKHLLYSFEQMTKSGEEKTEICLLMIDANRFKSINDTYGHIEGDAALVRIADSLRLSCKVLKHRATIARYGGDEFVILTRNERKEDIRLLKDAIRRNLSQKNEESGAPYDLTVSIGEAFFEGKNGISFKNLAQEADKALYIEKETLKNQAL